ncbi:MAG TPA: ZIP family metal transporter [Acidimicrobiales bacterium]|nr:ZIP family metal transporter [Acidimicrobiales bacterium]
MSEPRILLLGAVAGVTILFGLPVGRLGGLRPNVRHFLNALAVGVLLFLFWDVLSHAFEPVDAALAKLHDHKGGLWPVIGYAALFLSGIGVGLISLVYYERFLGRRRRRAKEQPPPVAPPAAGAGPRQGGTPGGGSAVLVAEAPPVAPPTTGLTSARQLAFLIAVGIGMHNFGEGLAIGGSAARGEIALATLLVIGFGLHNATEGFGIVAPLAARSDRPSWAFLLAMGLIGGGPTFVGTAVGSQFTSDALSVIFLTLAAGSILYVVIQLLGVAHSAARRDVVVWGLFLGLAAGFVTDMIVSAAGA